jgi:Ca-activated chloride channel family protein
MNQEGWFIIDEEGGRLPLIGASLRVTAAGGLAEVVLEQRFANPRPTPLTVIYSFPLPLDAAVAGFSFTIGDRRIAGELEGRQAARERFEQALLEGRSAGLVDQDRSTLFTQELGNIPAGAEVTATLVIEQRLRWLEEGQWEWRFPTAAGPRFQRADDAPGGDLAIARGPLPVRLQLALDLRDPGAAPESPSHRLRSSHGAVSFADAAGVPLDRDVVVRWTATPDARLERARPAAGAVAYGLLTVVPPRGERRPLPRDLIVLLDTSGSMSGAPLQQARAIIAALLDGLAPDDRFELVAFAREVRRFGPEPLPVAARGEALAWLGALEAGGGTEMRRGIEEALRPLRPDSQRQVVLVTDGLIGGEPGVVKAIAERLPAGACLHTVGVGSAPNRSLTGPAARVGRGLEVVVGLGEDVERAAQRLVARTSAPLVLDLSLGGSALVEHAPRRLPDLFAGSPALIGLCLRPEGGTLVVSGRTAAGPWRQTLAVPATAAGEGRPGVAHLFGREQIEDLETRLAAGETPGPLERQIEQLALALGLSSRFTSWVAVHEEARQPGGPIHRVRMPQQLPHGMSIEAAGLRRAPALLMRPVRPLLVASPATVVRGFVPPHDQLAGGPARPAAGMVSLPEERVLTGVARVTAEGLVVRLASGEALACGPETLVELLDERGGASPGRVLRVSEGESLEIVLALDPARPPPRALLIGEGARRVRVLL